MTNMIVVARHAALYTATELAHVTDMTTTARRAALYNHGNFEIQPLPKRI